MESGYAMRLLEGHPGGAGYLLKERMLAARRLMPSIAS